MLCQNGYFDLLSNKPTGLASSRLIKHELIYIQWYEHKLKQLRNFPFLVDPGIYKHLSERTPSCVLITLLEQRQSDLDALL